MSIRSDLPRLVLLLLSVVAFALRADSCLAQAEEITHFRPITIEEAPPELKQEIEIISAKAPYEYRLKMLGGPSGEPGGHVTMVRIESDQCEDRFCPTYIKYSYNKAGMSSVQTLVMQCDEWFFLSDVIPPPLKTSSGEIVGTAITIEVKTKRGPAEIVFTRLGPAVSLFKP
jgi:hypothetical protein